MLRCVKEQQRLLAFGEHLLREGRLDEAFEFYRKAFSLGDLGQTHVGQFVSTLLLLEESRLAEEKALRKAFKGEDENEKETDIFNCKLCEELFSVPVTLVCGHTFCVGCLEKYRQQSCISCPGCGIASSLEYSQNLLVRELMCTLVGRKVGLRDAMAEAERLLKEGKQQEFMIRVDQLMNGYPDEADVFHLRAKGFLTQARHDEALRDLETACRLKPYRSKAFFSRGELLSERGDYEEAITVYLRACVLKPDDMEYRAALTTCLCELFRKICSVRLSSTENIPLYPKGIETKQHKTVSTSPTKKRRCTFRASKTEDGDVVKAVGEMQENEKTRTVTMENVKLSDDHDHCSGISKTLPAESETRKGRTGPEVIWREKILNEAEVERKSDEDERARVELQSHRNRSTSNQGKSVLNELLECKLCYGLIYEPVTTPCGHTFCRSCLCRCLDHRFECPCCRANLQNYLELALKGIRGLSDVLETVLKTWFATEYNARKMAHEKELRSLQRNDATEIPVFVCTLAVPDIACPLHIFEPRYKLMIRRCMESGSRQFGMCVPDEEHGFAKVGTMLEITSVDFLADGRSVIHTAGGRRFKVLEKGMKDGYNTAKVEWLTDEETADDAEIQALSSQVYKLMTTWFSKLRRQEQVCIVQALGPMPSDQTRTDINGLKWLWWLLAAMPLNIEAKLIILSMTSVAERLSSAKRFLVLLLNRQRGVLQHH